MTDVRVSEELCEIFSEGLQNGSFYLLLVPLSDPFTLVLAGANNAAPSIFSGWGQSLAHAVMGAVDDREPQSWVRKSATVKQRESKFPEHTDGR